MQEVAEKLKGKCSVVSVDVDREQAIAKKHGISGIPAFAIVKNGEVVDTFTGFAKDFIFFKLAAHGVAF